METYIVLGKWTAKGIENVKDSPKRLKKARAAVKAHGGDIKSFYMTMGQYDLVLVCEAPSDEAFAKAMLQIASGGGVSTETLKAFPEKAYASIVGSL